MMSQRTRRLIFCKGGQLDGERLTRYQIAEKLGLSHSHVSRLIDSGVFYEKPRRVKRFDVDGKSMTVKEVMALPDAASISEGAMRNRLMRGDAYNRPSVQGDEARERRNKIREQQEKLIQVGETQVVSAKHDNFCNHFAAFAAKAVKC